MHIACHKSSQVPQHLCSQASCAQRESKRRQQTSVILLPNTCVAKLRVHKGRASDDSRQSDILLPNTCVAKLRVHNGRASDDSRQALFCPSVVRAEVDTRPPGHRPCHEHPKVTRGPVWEHTERVILVEEGVPVVEQKLQWLVCARAHLAVDALIDVVVWHKIKNHLARAAVVVICSREGSDDERRVRIRSAQELTCAHTEVHGGRASKGRLLSSAYERELRVCMHSPTYGTVGRMDTRMNRSNGQQNKF
jgi:hypothetical protein